MRGSKRKKERESALYDDLVKLKQKQVMHFYIFFYSMLMTFFLLNSYQDASYYIRKQSLLELKFSVLEF